jgi:hypothetical protein
MPLSTITNNTADTSFINANFSGVGSSGQSIAYGSNGYVFVCNSTKIDFYKFTPPASGVNTTPTASFTCSNPNSLYFFDDGANSYLIATSQGSNNAQLWKFNPSSITGTIATPTATFATGNTPSRLNVFPNGSSTYLVIACEAVAQVRMWVLDPTTITTTATAANTTFTASNSSAPRHIQLVWVSSTLAYLLAAQPGGDRVAFWKFNPSTIGATAGSETAFFGVGGNNIDGFAFHLNGASSWLAIIRNGPKDYAFARDFNPASMTGSISINAGFFSSSSLYGLSQDTRWLTLLNVDATQYIFASLPSRNEIKVFNFNSNNGFQAPILTFSTDSAPVHVFAAFETNIIRLITSCSTTANFWNTDLNKFNVVLTQNQPNNLELSKVSGGTLTLNSSVDSEKFFALARSGAARTASGIGNIVCNYLFSATTDSTGTLSESLTLSGSATITDANFALTMGAGTTLTLGSATPYNLPITIPSGRTVVLTQNTVFGPEWVFQNGSIISGAFSAEISYANPGITLVGATLITPSSTLRLFNLPTVANTVLRVKDLTSLVVTNPIPVAGEVTITVNVARSYEIRADAPGYLMQRVTLLGSTPEFAFSLQNFRTLYNSGSNISAQIAFNYGTLLATITDSAPTITFADMFRTIEDYLATTSGLEFDSPPYPVILPDRNILWFPLTPAAGVNPVRVKPNAANTTDPTLLFETYLEGAADPTYSLFDFVGVGGRIIRVRSVVAIANPDLQAIRDAMKLAPSAGVAAVASIDNKLDVAARNAIVTR